MTATDHAVRVSLREIRECTYRALSAHGASHGEAWTAARLVLEACVLDVAALGAVVADLAQPAWGRTPQTAEAAASENDLRLGRYRSNRVLREGPLAIDMVCGEAELNSVAAPCAVAAPSIVDMLLLELAAVRGVEVSALVASQGTGDTTQTFLRVACPDGSLGVASLESTASRFPELSGLDEDDQGVVGLGHDPRAGDLELSWLSGAERTSARANIAAHGLAVPHDLWAAIYGASRRYLVPD